ncbi:MAG TPA: hypothetical protein VH573_15690 [Mycobacteriales bacterium]
MDTLPPEYLDSSTPADVVVTDRLRPPIDDPTLGEPLGQPPVAVPEEAAHRLVTIGDSLTHGMSSAAVFRTDLSWPMLAAACLGIGRPVVPSYGGPVDGLPLNLERVLSLLAQEFGNSLDPLETLRLPLAFHRIADENEDYWERGGGSGLPRTDLRYENLGIYGWDVRDALSYTAGRAAGRVGQSPHDDFLGATPEHDNDIAANSVLAPFGLAATALTAADWHGRNGGIDTLVVVLGANNALRTVVDKRVCWSGAGYDDLDQKDAYNVWRPAHFAVEYAQLVRALQPIAAARVVLATVPHVTIAPIAKGVNPVSPGQKWRPGSRYFPYYTDPWIDESDFRPNKHRNLTHQRARAIDSAIDQYNDVIVQAVREARRNGRNWLLFDLCSVLDGLAFRRFITDDTAAAEHDEWRQVPLPAPIADLDTRFFLSDQTGRLQGGLFGLDGVHPTTCGYGIVAQALLDVLTADGVGSTPLDFAALRLQDTLNTDPPPLMSRVFGLLAPFLTTFLTRRPPPKCP